MSDMDKIWIYAYVIVVVIKTYHSTIVRHDESLSWSKASEICGNGGLEFNERILKGFKVLHGKTFWIGKAIYKKTSDWIEILGCYQVKDLIRMTEMRETVSVAECQIKCKSLLPESPLYFGYNEETQVCICARNIPPDTTAIKDCTDKTFSNAYFFYEVYQGHDRQCTTLKCLSGNNNLEAHDCSSSLPVGRCRNKATIWTKTSYLENLNWCIKTHNSLLLSPSTYCLKNWDQGTISWTNVFRNGCNCQLTTVEVENESPLKCLAGQLVNRDGKWRLKEIKRGCSEGLKWYVCRIARTQSVTSITTTHMTSNKTDSRATSPERLSSYMHSIASPEVTDYSAHSKHHIDDRDQKSTPKISFKGMRYSYSRGTVIGGLLGACSIIAVLAGLIVCKVRTIGFFRESSKHVKQETSQMQCSKSAYQDSNITTDRKSTTQTTSNETYGLSENSTAVYAVVHKIETSENPDETYTDAGYGEYDHLRDIQNRRMGQQENLYHIHGAQRNEKDLTYDSSDFGKGKTYDGNCVYDHYFSVVEGDYAYSTNKNHDNSITMGIYDKAS